MLFWILVICGLIYLFWLFRPKERGYPDSPLEVARLRYARGEISEEEYEEIVKKLRETG